LPQTCKGKHIKILILKYIYGFIFLLPFLCSCADFHSSNIFLSETKDACTILEFDIEPAEDDNTVGDSIHMKIPENNTTEDILEKKCVDRGTDCSYWESIGECTINPVFMNINCRKTCNFCDNANCSDSNELCSFWAKNGECDKNQLYMLDVCRESCGACQESEPFESSVCSDISPMCDVWAENGECEKNENYMLEYCKSSCNRCCSDDNENCPGWAEVGECENSSDYMHEYCKKSCNICHEFDMGVEQNLEFDEIGAVSEIIRVSKEYYENEVMKNPEMTRVRSVCKNTNENCALWASQNECNTNKNYMNKYCALSCRSCDQLDILLKCPKDLKSPDALKPFDLGKMFERVTNTSVGSEYEKYKPVIISRPPLDNSKNGDNTTVPWVVEFRSFLTDDECKHLIELGQKRGYERSMVDAKKRSDGFYDSDVSNARTSENSWCSDECSEDPIVQTITNRIINISRVPHQNMEDFQMLKYKVGQYYHEHHDFNVYHIEGPRILTFFIYLNDVEEGGETRFTKLDINVTPKAGKAILWPSVLNTDLNAPENFTYHEALPVIKGVKYAANAWIHLNDFKAAHKLGCTG